MTGTKKDKYKKKDNDKGQYTQRTPPMSTKGSGKDKDNEKDKYIQRTPATSDSRDI